MLVVVKGRDNVGEDLFCFLVEVGHLDTRSEDCVVGMLGSERGGGLSSEFIELGGGDAGVDALDHLLRDYCFVDKLNYGDGDEKDI